MSFPDVTFDFNHRQMSNIWQIATKKTKSGYSSISSKGVASLTTEHPVYIESAMKPL